MSDLSMNDISDYVTQTFVDLSPTHSWGELSFFFNPGTILPRGTYFCTLKEKDGDNDTASDLNREAIFRLNFGLPPKEFEHIFGQRPGRPAKGKAIEGPWNFTELDLLMPHPIYAWMGWVCVLNPGPKTFETAKPLLAMAYDHSVKNFNKRVRQMK